MMADLYLKTLIMPIVSAVLIVALLTIVVLLSLLWHFAIWTCCQGSLLTNLTEVNSADTERVMSMVAHPTLPDTVLATMSTYLSSIDLTNLNITILTLGTESCGGDDTLQKCKFDGARDIVEILPHTYAIADTAANCVRKLEWADDSQKVSYLSNSKYNSTHLMSISGNSRILRQCLPDY